MVYKKKNEEEGGSSARQACAACKHQRRKCTSDCVMAPYFPAEIGKEFEDTHKIFGVSNVTKLLQSLDSESSKKAASDSFKWEASAWKTDPVRGPLGVYEDLQKEYKELEIKYKELLTIGQGLVQQDQLNNHNSPINMGSTSQQLQVHHHQFVQNNIDNVNVSHPNGALMNIGRHGHGRPPPHNNNNIDHRYDHQYLTLARPIMSSPPVSYNYGPLVHDDYGRQALGRGSIIRPNSMSEPPRAYGLMPFYNNNNSNLSHGAGSSSILGRPSISNNIGNYSNMEFLILNQNEHDGGVPSNPAAAITSTAQPFHDRPSPPPPTQLRRRTLTRVREVNSL